MTSAAPVKNVTWVEPAAWDIVPGVNKDRYQRNLAKRRIEGRGRVVDRGYDTYFKHFMTFDSDYLAQQHGLLKANVNEAVVSASYVRALQDAHPVRVEMEHEAERKRALEYNTPWAKRARPAEPAPEPEEMVVRHIPFGPKGQTLRVEVPKSLDTGE